MMKMVTRNLLFKMIFKASAPQDPWKARLGRVKGSALFHSTSDNFLWIFKDRENNDEISMHERRNVYSCQGPQLKKRDSVSTVYVRGFQFSDEFLAVLITRMEISYTLRMLALKSSNKIFGRFL